MDSLSALRNINAGRDVPDGFVLSRAVGWTSVGMGIAELLVPRAVSSIAGLEPTTGASLGVRTKGFGDLALGLGILLRPRRPMPMWARVATDAIGLGLLAWAVRGDKSHRARGIASLVASVSTLALDAYATQKVTAAQETAASPVMFSVTINKPPAEVYAFFRRLENLPLFMDYLESVEQKGTRSHWIAKMPVGGTVSWDAELVTDLPGERLAWQTVAGSTFAHRGNVTFASRPGGTGTEVRVEMEVELPGVDGSATLAKLLTKPQIKGDLRRLKQVLETGEVLFSDASSHRGPHPAQPSTEGTSFARARATESRQAHRKGVVR
jgi:uncharacterized membrane protein